MAPKKGKKDKKGKKRPKEPQGPQFYEGTNAFILPNEDTYLGEYKAHVSGLVWREGKGVYCTADGQAYEGVWKDDKLIDGSEVTVTFKDRTVYTGTIVKNKYQGAGTYEFKSGMKIIGNFVDNKPVGDVTMVDVQGKLWHGTAGEDNVYLRPENIFFNNITKHRGLRRGLLKNLEPEFSLYVQEDEAETIIEGPKMKKRRHVIDLKEIEKQLIFGKSKKTNDNLDLTESNWYKRFAQFKQTRDRILKKLEQHETCTKEEYKWYYNYIQAKKLTRAAAAEVPSEDELSQENPCISTPVRVIYPSYYWRETAEEVKADEAQEEEEEAVIEEQLEVHPISEEVEEEVELEGKKTVKERNASSVCLDTDSLFSYVRRRTDLKPPKLVNPLPLSK